MPKRGTYAKTAARREEILNTALKLIAENGYSKATLKQVADAVGLSQMGVLHHFNTKEELFVAVLQRRDSSAMNGETRDDFMQPDALLHILRENNAHVDTVFAELARNNAETPGLIQLFTRLLAEATEEDHTAHEYFQSRISQLRTFVAAALRVEQEAGYISKDIDVDRAAVTFIALMDGLQTLWLYDDSINMEEHLTFFWDQVRGK